MFTRQIGKLIRGKATPFHLLAASILASLIAFIPGFTRAPGLMLCWIALLVILNANLFVAGVVGIAAKLVALLAAPVSFAAGRALLEGPTRGLFETLVNAPVFAWFGFDYYLVTGGQLTGLLFGVGAGLAAVAMLRSTWRKLSTLEKDSAAFQRWSQNRWFKISSFVFVGGLQGKQSYDDLLARRVGNPIRILGIVLVALFAVLGFVGMKFFDSAIVTAVIRSGLEKANGATVDLESADVDLGAGRLTMSGLALADPDELETNLFAAKSIEAKLSTSDLLRKRAAIDNVIITGATQGDQRAVKGVRIAPPVEEEGPGWSLPDMKPLDEVLTDAKVWKDRLATVRRWLERFSSSDPEAPAETPVSLEDRLKERVRLLGYANVNDPTLVQKSPRLLIRHLEAGEVKSAHLPGDTLTIVAANLSTEPHLAPEAPRFSVTAASGRLKADVVLAALAGADGAQLDFVFNGLSVDAVAAQLESSGQPIMQGGTMDIAAKGSVSAVDSNLPLAVTLHDTKLSIAGSSPTPVSTLTLPVLVRGPIDQPGIRVDSSALQQALLDAGKSELSRRLQEEAAKKLGIPSSGGDNLQDAAKGVLDGFLRGQKPGEEPKEAPAPAPAP